MIATCGMAAFQLSQALQDLEAIASNCQSRVIEETNPRDCWGQVSSGVFSLPEGLSNKKMPYTPFNLNARLKGGNVFGETKSPKHGIEQEPFGGGQ